MNLLDAAVFATVHFGAFCADRVIFLSAAFAYNAVGISAASNASRAFSKSLTTIYFKKKVFGGTPLYKLIYVLDGT